MYWTELNWNASSVVLHGLYKTNELADLLISVQFISTALYTPKSYESDSLLARLYVHIARSSFAYVLVFKTRCQERLRPLATTLEAYYISQGETFRGTVPGPSVIYAHDGATFCFNALFSSEHDKMRNNNDKLCRE